MRIFKYFAALPILFSLFLLGCPTINGTGLGSCFLSSGTPSGCIGSPNLPPSYVESGGFGLYTEYHVEDIDEDFRADNILLEGILSSVSAPNAFGTATHFGPELSGAANVPPPATPNNATAFIGVPDGEVPGLWLITWGGGNSQWDNYLQQHFGPLFDLSGRPWPNHCNGTQFYTDIETGAKTYPISCVVEKCTCQYSASSTDAFGPSNYVSPFMEEAGNLVDMHVTVPFNFTPGFTQGNVGVNIFDAAGNYVACLYSSACSNVTVTGYNSFTIPAWALAWGDNNRPGDYIVQILTLVNGTWTDFDSFGFSISNGGIPVFRYYSPSHGTHYFSVVQDGGNTWPYDYQFEGIGFHVYQHGISFQPVGNALSLYRLACCTGGGNGSWLLTDNGQEQINAVAAGWIAVDLLGDIMPYQYQNCDVAPCYTPDVPLYRIYTQTNGNANFFYTTNYSEYSSLIAPTYQTKSYYSCWYDDNDRRHCGWQTYTVQVPSAWIDQGIQGYVPVAQ